MVDPNNGKMQREAYVADERQQAVEKVLGALADRYNRMILTSTIDEPKSALQISREHGIPASTVYRKLHVLERDGLIKVDGSVIENGKRYYLYRSNIKAINIVFTMNTLKVDVILNKDMRGSAYW
ncbi:MAG: helix-turn-helix domain-containing protein [Candidatus Nitrosocaldus sp.]|nr:helix-turn-helix domain-containing protein [Candidatus Nitrosocaldus sp.]MCS7141270.1 helix-turn-helix domain-containing protein [Candidatus Nitrosocaldus sp.]MDW8000235.1 helix-turn-helix domain-containing protein [Candidatus Nitrosocaldus sp.]MDW8275997.1 helix-turn-helix domain-containing protein [Candidatus Nitrosocaldus sp.]